MAKYFLKKSLMIVNKLATFLAFQSSNWKAIVRNTVIYKQKWVI